MRSSRVSPTRAALEAFLTTRRQKDPERFPDLSLAVVKLLGRGEYAVDVPGQRATGHFGLAVQDYTHSTAPNRRYPDLITQRLIKAALAGEPAPYSVAELGTLAQHCTDAEDDAAKVERQVRKSAAALLLEGRIGETFDAFVTGASDKGTWVRLLRPPVEGRLVRGFDGLDVGDRVTRGARATPTSRAGSSTSRAGDDAHEREASRPRRSAARLPTCGKLTAWGGTAGALEPSELPRPSSPRSRRWPP